MKFFPIKVAIICLLVTPLLYIATLTSYEKYLNQSYSNKIQNILIGETSQLLNGSSRLEDQVARNIHHFLQKDWLVQTAKLEIHVIVTTANGKIIYPIFMDENFLPKDMNYGIDSQTMAKNNFSILNDGLIVKVETNLSHGSYIGNVLLIIYFGISFFIFLIFYKIGSTKAALEQKKRAQLIADLKKEEKIHKQILNELQKEREGLFENIKALNAKYQEDKNKAKTNEDEMFEEIINLEKKLNSFIELKENKELEIASLKSKILKYERRKGSKSKRMEFDFAAKRFKALYKTIEMNRKALSGFLNLNEDQQIKAEEIIQLLDQDFDKIQIKRKVFSGKKHRTACFEILFAYNGRLYFRTKENNTTEVLVVGTKNTQTKDMEFLHHL